jgi:hypothetical protein
MEYPDISMILLRGGTEANLELRRQAEAQITEMLHTNLPLALLTLTNEIALETKNEFSRRIAGTVFKNNLTAKNPQERKQREQVWLSIDPAARNEMKTRLVQTLASPNLYVYCSQLIERFSCLVEKCTHPFLLETPLNLLRT